MRKSRPPSRGTRVNPATAEKVVRPAQKPGNKKCRRFGVPRRSIKTSKKVASATPIKLAVSVALRPSTNSSPSQARTSEPHTPPSETKNSDLRTGLLSLIHELQGSSPH